MPLAITKIFGQTASAGELEYFSPRGKTTIIRSFDVCNPSATVHTFKAAVIVGGGVVAAGDYFLFDVPVGPKDTFTRTAIIILGSNDRLLLEDVDNELTFTAYGDVTS